MAKAQKFACLAAAIVMLGGGGAARADSSGAQPPQWRSDRADPGARFTYQGYWIGESLEVVKTAHGPFVMVKEIDNHRLVLVDDNFGVNPLRSWFLFQDGRLAALKMTYDEEALPAETLAKTLAETYGPPSSQAVAEATDAAGRRHETMQQAWATPSGTLRLEDPADRPGECAVEVNPELIEDAYGRSTAL